MNYFASFIYLVVAFVGVIVFLNFLRAMANQLPKSVPVADDTPDVENIDKSQRERFRALFIETYGYEPSDDYLNRVFNNAVNDASLKIDGKDTIGASTNTIMNASHLPPSMPEALENPKATTVSESRMFVRHTKLNEFEGGNFLVDEIFEGVVTKYMKAQAEFGDRFEQLPIYRIRVAVTSFGDSYKARYVLDTHVAKNGEFTMTVQDFEEWNNLVQGGAVQFMPAGDKF